jgi:hypothetical protein
LTRLIEEDVDFALTIAEEGDFADVLDRFEDRLIWVSGSE